MKRIKLTRGFYAFVDEEDFKFLNQFKWLCRLSRHKIYAIRSDGILMHRAILNVPPGRQTDHINGNGLDNQRMNLRICTLCENQFNRGKQINNTSGYKGVRAKRKNWRAGIGYMGKWIELGTYNSPIDAARAYDEAAKKYHGGFAKINFPE